MMTFLGLGLTLFGATVLFLRAILANKQVGNTILTPDGSAYQFQEDAAQLLQTSESHLRKMTATGKVPGAKFGRSWVYVRADLIELIRDQAKARAPRPIDIRALRGTRVVSGRDLAGAVHAELVALRRVRS